MKCLGAHIVGSDATEMIAEYGLAIQLEATAEDTHHTIHAHPHMSEAMMETGKPVFGKQSISNLIRAFV